MLSPTRDEDWQAISGHLPRNYEELAQQHKQLQVQYGNAKITTADLLLRFILLHVGANLPLSQTVALMAQAGGPKVSPMRLHMKMRRAAPYLQALVDRMAPWRAESRAELWADYSIVLVDGTGIMGPGATGVDARLHTKLRVSDMTIAEAEVTGFREGETFKRFYFNQGELVLADRGYCNGNGFAHVREQGADFLVRYNRGTLPPQQYANGKRFDALTAVRGLRGNKTLDVPISFEHEGERISGRFIATRLPSTEAAEARKRARAEYGAKVTEEMLEAASYVMLFTSVPRERMPASMCLLAYRLRWQIELQFKRWKSLCGFDRLPNYRGDTIIAWVYAKLLLGLLLDRMTASRDELSPPAQLEPVPLQPRRPRRRATVSADGSPALALDERPLPAARRRAVAADAS